MGGMSQAIGPATIVVLASDSKCFVLSTHRFSRSLLPNGPFSKKQTKKPTSMPWCTLPFNIFLTQQVCFFEVGK
jgi:hypothetical protein